MRTKRFLGVVLSVVMCLSLQASFTVFAAAEDTCTSHSYINGFCTVCDSYQSAVQNESGYYEIGNAGQLYWFADKVNNDKDNYRYANAILTDNITVNKNVLVNGELNTDEEAVNAFRVWTPIGNDGSVWYAGTFEGNGKTVSGLYFNDGTVSFVGLFGSTNNAAIQNVSVADSYFHGYQYVGGIAGDGGGNITNCHNAAYVYSSIHGYVGGIVGHASSVTVENCYNTGTVNAVGFVGGVVGQLVSGSVNNCYNTGTTANGMRSGGVVGASNGTVTNCYYLNTACNSGIDGNDVTGSAEAKTATHFASGEVAYLLQGQQETDVWGQIIGIDSYPVLGGMKVIFENDTYKNQVTEFEIISLGEDKKSANVAIPTAGTYTLILADYEESRLNNLDTITVTVENDNTITTVTSEKDITLGIGDKIMLWQDMTNLVPMCEAYVIK